MVVPAQAFWACPAVGNCSCTGFAIDNALHVSIFDAFCYQNDKMTHCAFAHRGNARVFVQNLYCPRQDDRTACDERIRQGARAVTFPLQ
ncbi:hypothetical protein AXY46_02420 [Achromobacter xylosoxidans]|nr:hypothetical protein AXY46_02420 [Achromobacter xylosoxidans]